MNQAIGLVEVQGLSSAIFVSDTMVKVANVTLNGVEKAKGHGWMTIQVSGDVGAVKASVEAGSQMAKEKGSYISSLVIPRPGDGLEKAFFKQPEPVVVEEIIEEAVIVLEDVKEDIKKDIKEDIKKEVKKAEPQPAKKEIKEIKETKKAPTKPNNKTTKSKKDKK